MNIGIVSDCYAPTKNGVTTAIMQAKVGLERRGHKIVILTVSMPGEDNQEPDVYRLPALTFRDDIHLRIGLATQATLAKIIKREQLEIIHTHTEFSLGLAARHAARSIGLPHIHTAHTMYEYYRHYLPLGSILPTSVIRRWLRYFYSGCDLVVCPSRKMQRYINALGSNIRSAIVPNGVDSGLFRTASGGHPRALFGIPPQAKILIFVGRLAQEKRVVELVKALSPLLKNNTDMKLLLVGDGPLRQSLQSLAASHDVQQQVILPGYVPWEEISCWYAAADLFITASLSEVHPMTLIEAAVSGLPIIARHDESCTDLVKDGQNGYLVESDAALAFRAFEILRDQDRHRRFSAQSVAISQTFTAQLHVDHIEQIYEQEMQGGWRAGTEYPARHQCTMNTSRH